MARSDLKQTKRAAASLGKAEADAAKAMEPFADSPWLEPVASLGDQPQLRTLSAALVAAGLAAGRRSSYGPRLARAGLRMLIAHEVATLAKNFVKRRIDRTRPRSLGTQGSGHKPSPGTSERKEETSFPSGHAAGSTAVARALAREMPEHKRLAAGTGAVLALVQVPRCAHYPTDIAAGAVIGLAAEAAVAAVWPATPRAPGQPSSQELELPPCGYC